jgi:hypothetical protein
MVLHKALVQFLGNSSPVGDLSSDLDQFVESLSRICR